MKRVTGIGGIFISAKDPAALQAWYKTHLGLDVQSWGGAVFRESTGTTVWSAGKGNNFGEGKTFMVNYRVDDLDALMAALKDEGCNVLEQMDDPDHGKFGWVVDPEGNKVELWQPPAGK